MNDDTWTLKNIQIKYQNQGVKQQVKNEPHHRTILDQIIPFQFA